MANSTCNGVNNSDEMKRFFVEKQKEWLRLKYPELFLSPKISTLERKSIFSQLESIDFRAGVLVCSPLNVKNLVFLLGVFKIYENIGGVPSRCHKQTLFVDVHFCDGANVHLLEGAGCDRHVLALWLGYGEIPSDREALLIEQRMKQRASQGPLDQEKIKGFGSLSGNAMWIFYKGTLQDLQTRCPRILSLAHSLNYSIVGLKPVSSELPDADILTAESELKCV